MSETAQPLTDTEYDRLGGLLNRLPGEDAMNLEALDGFFAALICCTDFVLPSEYLPEVWGGELNSDDAVFNPEEMEELLRLIMRHWNDVAATLKSDDVYVPLLLGDTETVTGYDWAKGFMKGLNLRRDAWADLIDDEDQAGSLVAIFALAHEHDPDPELRPYSEPVSAELREKLIVGIAAGVMNIYLYFAAERMLTIAPDIADTTYRRPSPKVGRNAPCPCGSGKRFKQCCGRVTVH